MTANNQIHDPSPALLVAEVGSAEAGARLILGPRRVRTAVLDGGWWPRSWNAATELSALIPALARRYGRIRSVTLSRASWTGQIRRLVIADQIVRVGWFSSMSPALLVAVSESGYQCDLVLVPPSNSPESAERAMAKAADPADFTHASDLLHTAGSESDG